MHYVLEAWVEAQWDPEGEKACQAYIEEEEEEEEEEGGEEEGEEEE